MAFLPISTAQCHDKFWFRPQRFGFARHQGLVELIAAELPSAACALPIGFIPTPEGHYQPVAVLGIEPNRNLYVAQDETWLAGHVPLRFQQLPFAIAPLADREMALCVDEAYVTSDARGLPFFTAEGALAPALEQARAKLQQFLANRHLTQQACVALAEAGLFKPWQLIIPRAHTPVELQGLFCLDEQALNQVDGAMLVKLRDCGALAIAYCQLMAMQHAAKLGALADAQAKYETPPQPRATAGELDLSFLSNGGTLQLGGL